jgi:hypothetical protein
MGSKRAQLGQTWWLAGATVIAGIYTLSACGEEATTVDPGATTLGADAATSSSGASGGSSGAASSSGTGSSSGGSSSGDGGGSSGDPATPANFKVAFIGDTDQGGDFTSVLNLIKAEGAQAVMVQGDLTYSFHSAQSWVTAADGVLQSGGTNIPYFAARGNHDWDWKMNNGLGAKLDAKLATWGVTADSDAPSNVNYSLTYKGLKMVFLDSGTSSSLANYAKTQLANDKHYWKICAFHKNMRDTNVGPKDDEMSWGVYENCREAGAIVAQGHSHTYSRSKTVTADQALTLDSTCTDPFALCVGPGKHFFFDSSIGGEDLRSLEQEDKPHWASSYSSDFGALFIEFNVDGDPKKAKGYFKTVGKTIIDPPANSGKAFFTITSSN